MKNRLILLFLLLSSFSIATEKQLARDPQALLEFSKKIASIPVLDFPQDLGCNYSNFYSKIKKMNSIALSLQNEGEEISANLKNKGIFDLVKEFFGFYDEKSVKNAIDLYNEWVDLHNSIEKKEILEVFQDVSNCYALSNFSGLITVNGLTYSSISYEFSKGSEIKKAKKIPYSLYPETEPACVLRFKIGNNTHIFGKYPCYIKKFFSYYAFTGHPLALVFYFSISEENIFVPQDVLITKIGEIGGGEELEYYAKAFSDLSNFLKGAKGYVSDKEKEGFRLFEKVLENASELDSELKLFNSSKVQRALSISVSPEEVSAAPEMSYKEKIKEAYNLLNSKGKLGERALKINKAINLLKEASSEISKYRTNLVSDFEAMKEACKIFRKKAKANVSCEYSSISDVDKLASSILEAYSKYLILKGEEKEAFEALKEEVKEELENLKDFFERASRFIPVKDSIEFDKDIKEISARFNLAESISDLDEVRKEISSEREEICYSLISNRYSDSLNLVEKARKIYKISSELSLNLSLPLYLLSPPSPISGECEKILLILESEGKISKCMEELEKYKEEISSNIPASVNCSIPLLGASFYESCVINATNPWPEPLSESFSSLTLPYNAGKIDKKAVVSGDVSKVESLVGIGRELRIKWKNLEKGAIVLIKFKTKVPLKVIKVNESSSLENYSVTYKLFSDCKDYGYAVIKHPFSMHVMNSSRSYKIYNKTHIAILIRCNKENFVKFWGKPYKTEIEGNKTVIEKIVNTSLPIFVSFEGNVEKPHIIGNNKFFVLEKDREEIVGHVEGSREDKSEKLELKEEKAEKFEEEMVKAMLEKLSNKVYGCIPENIVKETEARFYMPKPRCVKISYDKAREYFKEGKYKEAENEIQKMQSKEQAYLTISSKYKRDAEIAIGQLKSLIKNPISRKRAEVYLKEAEEAYGKGDFIRALYFAKFGILKASINLETPLRIVLALLVVALAFVFSKKKEEEDLI